MKGIYIENNILKRYIGEETRVDLTPNFHLKEVAADAFPLDQTYIIKLGYFTNANRKAYPETACLNETFMAFMTFLAKLGDKEKEHFAFAKLKNAF